MSVVSQGEVAGGEDLTPDSGVSAEFHALSPEEQEEQRRQWQAELAKVEDEIATFRHVLASKVKQANDLKRKLGISVWKELQDDMSQGLKNVKETAVFQKTESVVKTAAEKTTSILGGFGVGFSSKIGQLKNSESFRSFEEKVGSAYENVKTRVSSRSNSVTSFDDALREADGHRPTPLASPTIPEDRPLP
ncbi:tumor protein D52 isoform X2 [Neocloeon triangulifer]|uniref:tumor protein D52 isoform X2 n=1 Tax=Neocloeon triangulifer TaxID=2078957 RepID=UPI00286F7A7B|nr:tumor protein D52 isoform X2 [Neocloeon triangulifer]